MASETRTVYVCVYCETPIDEGYMYGAGDGTGQRFAHPLCWLKRENKRLTADVERLTRDSCVDCGSPVLICDHAAKTLLDPERSFHAGQIEEMTTERDALAAQVAALREAGSVLAEYVEHQPFSLARLAAIEAWRAALAAAGGEDS